MKTKLFLLIVISFIANQAILAQGETNVLFKRSTLLVADMEKSLTIYRDVLGFSMFGQIKNSTKDSYSYPVFKVPKEATIRFATLNSKTQERTLALTEVKGVKLPKPNTPLMSAIVIKVDNIQLTMDEIRKKGLETTAIRIVESKRLNYKEQAFIDYDGHLVVLYEVF